MSDIGTRRDFEIMFEVSCLSVYSMISVWEWLPTSPPLSFSRGYLTSKQETKELRKINRWWQKECGEEHKSVLHLGTKYEPLFNESEWAWSWQTDGGRSWGVHDTNLLICNPFGGECLLAVAKQWAVPQLGSISWWNVSWIVIARWSICCSRAGRVRVSLPVLGDIAHLYLHTETCACSSPLSLFLSFI